MKNSLRERITKKEIVVRMLMERPGEWQYGYELQGKHTQWGFSGVDADTRAHELSRIGYFDSPHNRYYVEHRGPRTPGNPSQYAQFRAFKGETPQQINKAALDFFENYVGATQS